MADFDAEIRKLKAQREEKIDALASPLLAFMREQGWTELHIERNEYDEVEVKVADRELAPTPYVVALFGVL